MIIPIEEIQRSLTTENPWWESGEIPKRINAMPRRAYFGTFSQLVKNREINRAIILLGPRRVGKTILVNHVIHDLISSGTSPNNIMYVSIDTPTYTDKSLQFFVDMQRQMFNLGVDEETYIIFDEVQYLANWEGHLKVLVDRYHNIRFIASGSAAAALKLASQESGAGRFSEFMLPPLTFSEYLHFIGKDDLIFLDKDTSKFFQTNNIEILNKEFINYLNFGGYPEAVVSDQIRADAARFIKQDIIDKVLLRDLPQLYGITNIQELNRLFTSLAYRTGQEISLDSLARESGGISKPTISKYIEYLEAAFLIKRMRRVDSDSRSFSRDFTFKIYLTNPSMRAALFSPAREDEQNFGSLVETAVVSQWIHAASFKDLHYARWKRSGKSKVDNGDFGEIDIVSLQGTQDPAWLVEIKWSDSAIKKTKSWDSLREFCRRREPEFGIVFTSKTIFDHKMVDGVEAEILPTACYCYTIGFNTTKSKMIDPIIQ